MANSKVIVRRASTGVSKARFNEAVERARGSAKRLREATKEDESAMVSVGTGIALAVLESKVDLPSYGGIDPLLLGGAAAYAFTRKAKGKSAVMLKTAAIAALTIGANRQTADQMGEPDGSSGL